MYTDLPKTKYALPYRDFYYEAFINKFKAIIDFESKRCNNVVSCVETVHMDAMLLLTLIDV